MGKKGMCHSRYEHNRNPVSKILSEWSQVSSRRLELSSVYPVCMESTDQAL